MPVIIDNSGKVSVTDAKGKKKDIGSSLNKTCTPTFFHKTVLTGRGKKTGLLCESRNPCHYPNGYSVMVNMDCRKQTTQNGDTTIHNIPFYMISPSGWSRYIKTFQPEPMTSYVKIATDIVNKVDVYIEIAVHAAQVEERKAIGVNDKGEQITTTIRDMSVCFHTFLFFTKDINDPTYKQESGAYNPLVPTCAITENTFTQTIHYNMYTELQTLCDALAAAGYAVDKQSINDYFKTYDLYTNICHAADRIVNNVDKYIIDALATNIAKLTSSYRDPYGELERAIGALESYDVPIQKYNDMYQSLIKIVPADKLSSVCRTNLNMMLADTLHNMNANRSSLKSCPNNVPLSASPVHPSVPYSMEQSSAIESTEPLTIVQSGAGTGKSTIILGRIQHMIDNGIDPKTILVLSFTNNAATHILDKNPNVNSMTIDKMMCLIYAENYPNQRLSSLSTIINSLDIYYDPNTRLIPQAELDFVHKFARILQKLRDKNEFTAALNFISDHNAETVKVLETIQQTSLELQSIICYLNMNTLVEPPETYAEHLIIDEVQDNSISQFIYCIGYTAKHHNSMYIVGDCSQTLYEFRGSNPKALNMLEASGVFKPYKLQTNYRSNQAILDFANIYLANIEANEFANIRLHANDLTPITAPQFQEAVQVNYQEMPNRSEDSYARMFEESITDIRDWIMSKLNKGEQVAFLAMKHDELNNIESRLNMMFPSVPAIEPKTRAVKHDDKGNVIMEPMRLVSLVPKRQYDNTVISKFIAKYWNTINYAPPTDIISTIECEMLAHQSDITFGRISTHAAQRMINDTMIAFKAECGHTVKGMQSDVQHAIITQKQMLDELKKMLLVFEISHNSIAQAVMSSINNENRTNEARENAHFIISTIHSAKGLEFKNCVVYYNGSSDEKMAEDRKRLYYVAFTRAMESEIIIPYDNIMKPKIVADYNRLVTTLEKADAARAAGADDDDSSNDTVCEDEVVVTAT